MKKAVSLLLALALSLTLAVPALAAGEQKFQFEPYSEEKEPPVDYDPNGTASGKGWSYDGGTKTLTLNGIQSGSFYENNLDFNIVLAPGSKNRIYGFSGGLSTVNKTLTISGTGELVICPAPNSIVSTEYDSMLCGAFDEIVLKDGLAMTGGHSEKDSFVLELGEPDRTHEPAGFGTIRRVVVPSDGNPAQYVRIAPAAGAKPAETPKPAASSTGFTDVAANSPYAEAIKWAVGKKITTGKTATTFGPGDPCTVGQANIFLWRNAGRPEPTNGYGNDMDMAEMWALNDAGYMDRLDDRSDTCTRLWFVYALWVAAGQPAASKAAGFTDVSSLGEDGRAAINWAVEKGVTTGKTADAFAPSDPCTRGQIVTFLYRACK